MYFYLHRPYCKFCYPFFILLVPINPAHPETCIFLAILLNLPIKAYV